MARTLCPYCNTHSQMECLADGYHLPLTQYPTFGGQLSGPSHRAQAPFQCTECHGMLIGTKKYIQNPSARFPLLPERENPDFWISEVSWSPLAAENKNFPDVPESIAKIANEAYRNFCIQSYRSVGSMVRAAVEATAKDKGFMSGDLEKKINELAGSGMIRQSTKEEMHELRWFDNDSSHGDVVLDPTREHAENALELMNQLFIDVYESPARSARMAARNRV